jgi:BirA family biotin operon repressor/biotin-[acetyl-CoA-carboxylase] ligase
MPFGLVADEQSAGRGRRGRTWTTLPGRSLALTLALPAPKLERPARLTLIVSVATARACERTGSPSLAIKWPNDLLRDDRKAGGVLVETARTAGGEPVLLVGIGLNLALKPGELAEVSSPPAGDLGLTADASTRDALALAVAGSVIAALADPDDPSLGREYRRRSWLTGRAVVVDTPDGPKHGVVAEITPEGDIVLVDGTLLRGEHSTLLEVEGPRAR